MGGIKSKARELIEVTKKIDICIIGILDQTETESWLDEERRELLQGIRNTYKIIRGNAQSIVDNKTNRSYVDMEEQSEIEQLDIMIRKCEEWYRKFLETLNFTRKQKGLKEVGQTREIN